MAVTERTNEASRVDSGGLVGFAYQPALDGVRGVAVSLVLVFHAGFSWMPAGYLGVSVFFTLSGFLITTLLLGESVRTGSVAIAPFFVRRLKRLMPASLLCLGVVAALRVAGAYETVPNLRAELIGAVANVYNWVKILGDTSYSDLFADAAALTSPLEHYWSLAIEEQFYLVWPFVMLWIARRSSRAGTDLVRSSRRTLTGAFVATAVAAPVIAAVFGGDVAYWSTPTRLPELLAAAALAAWMFGRTIPAWARRLALPAIVLIMAASTLLPTDSGPAYSGFLSLFALVSAALLLGLQHASPVRDAISAAPVVWVGKLSYGIYLFHWPIFTMLRRQGRDLTRPVWFVVGIGAVLVCAAVSFYGFERPVRRTRFGSRRTIPFAVAAMLVGVFAFAVVPFRGGFLVPERNDFVNAAAPPANALTPLQPPRRAAPPVERAPADRRDDVVVDLDIPEPADRPMRVLVVGDSTSLKVATGVARWVVEHPSYIRLNLLWCPGCGFIRNGTNVTIPGASEFATRAAEVVEQEMPDTVRLIEPDVVVLMNSVEDIVDRQWSSEEGPLTPFDPVFQERMAAEYQAINDELTGLGVPLVVWVKPPVPIWLGDPQDLHETERWQVMDDVIDEVAERGGDAVTSIDLDEWMHAAGYTDSADFRFDNVHITEDASYELAKRWLVPTLLDLSYDHN